VDLARSGGAAPQRCDLRNHEGRWHHGPRARSRPLLPPARPAPGDCGRSRGLSPSSGAPGETPGNPGPWPASGASSKSTDSRALLDGGSHLAFVLGDLAGGEPPLVRVHVEPFPRTCTDSRGASFRRPWSSSPRRDAAPWCICAGMPTPLAWQMKGQPQPQIMSDREFGVGAQILRQLGHRENGASSAATKPSTLASVAFWPSTFAARMCHWEPPAVPSPRSQH